MVLPKIAKPRSYLYYDISIQLSAGVFEFLVRTLSRLIKAFVVRSNVLSAVLELASIQI